MSHSDIIYNENYLNDVVMSFIGILHSKYIVKLYWHNLQLLTIHINSLILLLKKLQEMSEVLFLKKI